MGPPGAGKGTQAARIAADLRIPHVSTGEILRRAVGEGTPVGIRAKPYLDAGTLVPDDVIAGVVSERLAKPDCAPGFLLDGFPRTLPQASLLDARLSASRTPLSQVISLEVPAKELVARMMSRGRADDTPETVQRRLEVYESETEPLKGWYRSRGLLREVDGTGTPDEVFSRLVLVTGLAAR